jgi:putative RecB family exonuclease
VGVTPRTYDPVVTLAPLPSSISPSKVGTFTDCPRLFKYQSIDRLEQPPTIWTLKGNLVHAALEGLFSVEPALRTLEVALGALDAAVAAPDGVAGIESVGLEGLKLASFQEESRSLVHRYFELEDPTKVDAVGVELRVETTLTSTRDGAPVHLRGIIDRLDRNEAGDLVVVDYKTGRAPAPGRERARLAAVETYALLCERALGVRPVMVRLMYLAAPVVIERTIGASEVRRQERRTVEVWHAISRSYAAGTFRPSPGPLCNFCAYTDLCEAAPASLRARASTSVS